MRVVLPVVEEEQLPALCTEAVLVHKLAGSHPEYLAEPRVLLEGNGHIKGCKVLHTEPLSLADGAAVARILEAHASYGDRGMGARCFFPGFAFTFGTAADAVHIQVCLECSWLVFHSADGTQSVVPSVEGEALLRSVYERLVA